MPLVNPVDNPQAFRELLNPGYCFSPVSIRQFLTLSRKYSDDNLDNSLPRTGDCKDYITTVLFPAWASRDSLLAYCESVADDEMKSADFAMDETSVKAVVDPRMDPYGARPTEKMTTKGEEIMQWIGKERKIESIVRTRTANLLATKCGTYSTRPDMYLAAYERR
jgi:hypothetical protein